MQRNAGHNCCAEAHSDLPHPAATTPAAQKSQTKFGNEHEAIAVYQMLRAVQKFCPVYTLGVGNAFGEAALLLSAGSPGKRAALRSATIMIRQPLQRLSGMQASDIDIYRKVTRDKTSTMVRALMSGELPCPTALIASYSGPAALL